MSIPTTPAALAAAASTLLTLLLMIFPPARVWFAAQTAEEQRAVRGVVVLVVAVASVYFGCTGVISGFTCTQTSVLDWVATVVMSALSGMAGTELVFGARRTRIARTQDKDMQVPTLSKLLH